MVLNRCGQSETGPPGKRAGIMASLSKPESKPLWARDLSPIGLNYFGGVVDNAEEILENHKLSTQCSFGTRTSTSSTRAKPAAAADVQDQEKENKNPNEVSGHPVCIMIRQ